MDDDCRAVRLAHAFRCRFGPAAGDRAAMRLGRAVASGNMMKADLFVAVHAVLRDRDAVFSRSRTR